MAGTTTGRPLGPGHNGGPSLEQERRPRGRPSIATEELKDAIMDRLAEGVPLRAICREPGMPPESTVRGWRQADPRFDRGFRFAQEGGFHYLMEQTLKEFERNLDQLGARKARRSWNQRRYQLARQNPAFFGGQ